MPIKNKDKKASLKSLKGLNPYMRKYRIVLVIAMLLALLGAMFSLIGPNKLSDMTNLITDSFKGFMNPEFTGSVDMKGIEKIAWLLVILYALGALFNYIQGVIMATVTHKVTQKLRSDIEQKMTRLPLSYYDRMNFGDVLSRMTNDVDTVDQTLNQSLGTLITAVSLFVGSLIMMIYTNIWMTIAAVVATILGFIMMGTIMGFSQRYFKEQQQNLGKMNAYVEEAYNGHQIMKAFNGEKQALKDFAKLNENLFNSAKKATYLSGLMMPLMRFVGNLGYVAVCVVGAYLCFNNKIEFGVIVAFMLYIRLFIQPLSQIAQVFNALQQTAAASDRIFEFLNEPEMTDETGLLTQLDKQIQGKVTFDNVHFGYTEDKIIINDFNLEVKPHQTVAIVGPTGAGKTTIINLLMKFYELNSGDIYLDDIPISKMTRELVHDQFCMVLQDTWLFDGTVKENIIYNRQDVTEEDVKRACKAVGVDHFIQSLAHGYNTKLTEANNMSQGQKQLITIARAAISKSPFVILDEATSSVDTRTEIIVQKAMNELMKNRTSFVIAHRLSTIRNADLIIVMNAGDIVEQGTHESLLAKNGFYSELYNSQFQ